MKKIYFFIGTTAELIKIASVIRKLRENKIDFRIISSNQSPLHFEELSKYIKKKSADYTFKMKPFKHPKNLYLRFAVWTVKSIGNYIIYFRNEFKNNQKNTLFVVHGDTVTAVIGSIIARLCGVKLVHIEAGLRSFSFLEPFPEELCRYVISRLANIHFCPNKWALNNLKTHPGVKINTFFNTAVETTKYALNNGKMPYLEDLKNTKYFVLVIHRQEHTLFNRKTTKNIIKLILDRVDENMKCVFIMHRLTHDYLKKQNMYTKISRNKNILLLDRVPYVQFVKLIKASEFMATDGGGNQEECYYLGKPCLILRKRTERIEGLGENALLSQNKEDVINNFINNYKKYDRGLINVKYSPSNIILNILEKI